MTVDLKRPIVYASDCKECELCGEPICPNCDEHYAECPCPGPHSFDEDEWEDPSAPLTSNGD